MLDKPEPVFLRDGRVTADGVVLVCDPDDEDDVEGRRRVLEELGHDGFHPWKAKNNKNTVYNVIFTISR